VRTKLAKVWRPKKKKITPFSPHFSSFAFSLYVFITSFRSIFDLNSNLKESFKWHVQDTIIMGQDEQQTRMKKYMYIQLLQYVLRLFLWSKNTTSIFKTCNWFIFIFEQHKSLNSPLLEVPSPSKLAKALKIVGLKNDSCHSSNQMIIPTKVNWH
jgi:hypothetical protein